MTNAPAQVSQRVIMLTIVSVLGAFLTYQVDAWFSRNLGPSVFGDFKFLLRALHMGGHIGLLGQDSMLVMMASRYDQQQEHGLGSGLISWILRTYIARVVCLYALIFIGQFIYAGTFGSSLVGSARMIHDGFYTSLMVVFYAIPVLVASGLCEKYFIYRRMFFSSLVPRAVILPIVIYSVFVFLGLQWKLENAVWIYALCISTLLVGYLIRCGFLVRQNWQAPKLLQSQWWQTSLQFFSINVIVTSGRNVVFFLLEFMGKDESDVGYFAAILAVIINFHMIVRPVEGFLRPYISRLVIKEKDALMTVMRKCNQLRFSLVGAYYLILLIFAYPIMLHFGPAFGVTVWPMIFMATCFLIYTMGQPNVDLLSYSGHQNVGMYIWIIQIVLSIILAVVLIPTHGVWAAVIADGSTMVLSVLLATLLVRFKLGYHAWVI